MTIERVLVANRGEIAVRIIRAAAELGIGTVAVHAEDDADCLHTCRADEVRALAGAGPRAYLDVEQLLSVARDAGCDAVHPGYGFLSEHAGFARRCREERLTFVGPRPEVLELFGDKARARATARFHAVPVLRGSDTATSAEEARELLEGLGAPVVVKAVAGGGGRGVRVVRSVEELEDAYVRCRSEAEAAFGSGEVYVEELLEPARHVEVQVAGDGTGAVAHVWERDCSIQRRHQKLVEVAPAPGLPGGARDDILAAATRLAAAVRYDGLGTFEFLVDAADPTRFAFIEANTRLQVEHTVTEEVTGLDLVHAQLGLADGRGLAEVGLDQGSVPRPRGVAVQVRVNTEELRGDGTVVPTGGTITDFEPPSGRGVRVDTHGYRGYRTNPRFDPLLAKVVVHSPATYEQALTAAERALSELRVEGADTNVGLLRALLEHPEVRAGQAHTRFVDDHLADLLEGAGRDRPRRYFPGSSAGDDVDGPPAPDRAGARVDASDPLAVLEYGRAQGAARRSAQSAQSAPDAYLPAGTVVVEAPLQGTVVSVDVAAGATVRPGQPVAVMEALKMEHEVRAEVGGTVQRVEVGVGDTVYAGHPLLLVEEAEVGAAHDTGEEDVDLDEIRADLAEVLERRAMIRDENRPGAVERRRAKGQRTAQENVEDLLDPGSVVEYAPLALAAQRARRSRDELIERSPRDGMITAVGTVNGDLFDEPASRCAVIAYDYTVFAGTQGARNHAKTDRLLDVAEQRRMPLVLFAEGGGGRPGDTEGGGGGGLSTFHDFPRLSGLVPLVGITTGRCFAGNASLLACCDVIIATDGSNIGMGGPAMIEGGGLGVFAPEDIGPMEVQVPNGVVDVAVADEAEAVAAAKRYLAYFQGRLPSWEAPDQRRMRRIVPENRVRVYNVRDVVETLADAGSVLELRRHFGVGIVTALIRVEGRPLGVVANNPMHLGGAIDVDGADKASRFMQLCDAFDLPLLFLCDTPGIMVGPEAERTALVRHANRMFLVGANLSVPFFTVVLRKSYGLGAIAMAGGSFKVPAFAVSWPTGEFGGMGLEGSVKLGYRDELAAIEDREERQRRYEQMVARAYERGKALNNAASFGVDDAIDPAETRDWVARTLRTTPAPPPRQGKKRPFVDAW